MSGVRAGGADEVKVSTTFLADMDPREESMNRRSWFSFALFAKTCHKQGISVKFNRTERSTKEKRN